MREYFISFMTSLQTESRQMEYQMDEINFLISLTWAEIEVPGRKCIGSTSEYNEAAIKAQINPFKDFGPKSLRL